MMDGPILMPKFLYCNQVGHANMGSVPSVNAQQIHISFKFLLGALPQCCAAY